MTRKTPFEEKVEEEIKALDRTAKMEMELRKFGKPVRGGYVMTGADLARYFKANLKRLKA